MDADKFLDLVKRMRTAQISYFARRTFSNLVAAKQLEKKVDEAIHKALFDNPTDPLNETLTSRPDEGEKDWTGG